MLWEDAENVTNRTVKAPPKTGQNAAPGGISRPQLALRGTSLEPLDLVGVGTPPRFPPARLAAGPVRLRARHPLYGYGIRRFPVTFYADEWETILENSGEIRRFIAEHPAELKRKRAWRGTRPTSRRQ